MLLIEPKDRITLKYLIESAVDGEIYDVDVDRWLGVHLTDNIRQQIKAQLKEIVCYSQKYIK